MKMTRTRFLKAILAVSAAPLVPRPEVDVAQAQSTMKINSVRIEGSDGFVGVPTSQGQAGDILIWNGHVMQWHSTSTTMQGQSMVGWQSTYTGGTP